jgi:hypothetical protein
MADSQEKSGTGLSLFTLVIAAIASACTALVVREIWGPGTIFGAAMSPVLVALISEALRKPQKHVARVAPTLREKAMPLGTLGRPGEEHGPEPRGAGATDSDSLETREPLQPEDPDAPPDAEPGTPDQPTRGDDPFGLREPERRLPGADLLRRRWKLAVATGLLAFAIAATVLTAAELAAGGSAAGDGRTTVFGGATDGAAEEPVDGEAPDGAPPPADAPPEEGAPPPREQPAEPTPSPSPEPTPTPTPAAPAPEP